MSLTNHQLDAISRQVYTQFPDMKGARPSVQPHASAKSAVASSSARFIVTFKGRGHGPGGQSIQRIVRVVADERGKVLKMSTSR
jgi:hypothetical protein